VLLICIALIIACLLIVTFCKGRYSDESVRRLPRLGILFILNWVLSGYAISHIDNQGLHYVIGILQVSILGVVDDKPKAGDKVEVTNIGILISHGPLSSRLSVVYNRESTMNLKIMFL
jgi:hypothetical protein